MGPCETLNTSNADYNGKGATGVWETILEEASFHIAEYLSSPNSEGLNITSSVAHSMLRLIDQNTLRSIIRERNADNLCGKFGCSQAPKYSLKPNDAFSLEGAATLEKCMDSHLGYNERESSGKNKVQFSLNSTPGDIHWNEEKKQELVLEDEVVYDEDVFVAESFRIALKNAEQLRRIKARAVSTKDASSPFGHLIPIQVNSGAKEEKGWDDEETKLRLRRLFCSEVCYDVFISSIFPRISPLLDYNHPLLVESIGSLFPNLRLEVLQQMAKSEVQGSPLLGEIKENSISVTKGLEVGDHLHPIGSSIQGKKDILQAFVKGMREAHQIWSSASMNEGPSKRGGLPNTSSASQSSGRSGDKEAAEKTAKEEKISILKETVEADAMHRDFLLPRGKFVAQLKGIYLVHDFLLNICGARCSHAFLSHYIAHSKEIQAILFPFHSQVEPLSICFTIVQHLCAAMEAKRISDPPKSFPEEPFQVDKAIEHQRRSALYRHVFSSDSTSALSRLLLLDEQAITSAAWHGVWQSPPPGSSEHFSVISTFNSLVFPFPVPSQVLMPMHSCRESLLLGIVFVMAAACVHPLLLEEFLGAESEICECLEVLGIGAESLEITLRSILLPSC